MAAYQTSHRTVFSTHPLNAEPDIARLGAHWHQATLTREPDARWGWPLWQIALEFDPGTHEVVVRAFDGAGQTQPAPPRELERERVSLRLVAPDHTHRRVSAWRIRQEIRRNGFGKSTLVYHALRRTVFISASQGAC
ncbi:hypothetical protein [Larsenimonas suaedae]|uniref:Uncharacterized protein n=1 Tax=Larsenimonas suaedae TaxID=1851019 RepID=A0ABU1GRJ4_9GAMM|nr:hypothetical protein [Larsenimonas suaedae]MCM2972552.1 hypothetical protein [Larsenimonas suaedae]MDR5894652.1 hypothetical protein [Larsenimonas suaedae]